MKHIIISAGLLCCSSAQAINYLHVNYLNNYDHFDYPQLNFWQITSSDQYFSDEFFAGKGDVLMGIKPVLSSMMATYDPSIWQSVNVNPNNATVFGGLWSTGPFDRYVTGDYTANNQAEIMAVNLNGAFKIVHADPQNANVWHELQSGGSEIFINDALLSGDFNGSAKDDILLIQPTYGNTVTSTLNQQSFVWDRLNRTWNGLLATWPISQNDTYVVGDFNDDGQDELLAINVNGDTETMHFVNNQWTSIGSTTGGFLGSWNVTTPATQYLAIDFDRDGKEEVIAINTITGWSHILSMSTNPMPQWNSISDNDGLNLLSENVKMNTADIYLEYNHQLLQLNPNGQVTLLKK